MVDQLIDGLHAVEAFALFQFLISVAITLILVGILIIASKIGTYIKREDAMIAVAINRILGDVNHDESHK